MQKQNVARNQHVGIQGHDFPVPLDFTPHSPIPVNAAIDPPCDHIRRRLEDKISPHGHKQTYQGGKVFLQKEREKGKCDKKKSHDVTENSGGKVSWGSNRAFKQTVGTELLAIFFRSFTCQSFLQIRA